MKLNFTHYENFLLIVLHCSFLQHKTIRPCTEAQTSNFIALVSELMAIFVCLFAASFGVQEHVQMARVHGAGSGASPPTALRLRLVPHNAVAPTVTGPMDGIFLFQRCRPKSNETSFSHLVDMFNGMCAGANSFTCPCIEGCVLAHWGALLETAAHLSKVVSLVTV